MRRPVASTLALVLAAAACGRPAPDALRLEGATMGTTWGVDVPAPPAGLDAARLRTAVEDALAGIERAMSTYDPASEVSRFNASAGDAWFPVSAATHTVIAAAQDASARTGGAFDVTVGPLVEVWGFGPGADGGGRGRRPSAAELEAARAIVGAGRLELRAPPAAIRKRDPGVRLDLSGIAKGFAVDEVAAVLEEAGVRRYLVEIGGELRARGTNAAGRPWLVAVERPATALGAPPCFLELVDGAVATSGDYRRGFVDGGTRYSHVLDPRTGEPVRTGVVSATVVAPTAMEADALATALMVLPPREGLSLTEREGLAARLLVREGEALVERRSAGFPEGRP